MADSWRDRTGGGFGVSILLRLENLSSPAPGTERSWSPSGEGKPGTQGEQFYKFRGFSLKMDRRPQSRVGRIRTEWNFV